MISWLMGSPLEKEMSSGIVNPQNIAYWVYKMLGAGGSTNAGVDVNAQSSMTYAAVWRALNVMARTIGRMPVKLYRSVDGRKEQVTDHRVLPIVRRNINPEIRSRTFFETGTLWGLMHGMAYAKIERVGGLPVGLSPLKPWHTTLDRDLRTEALFYRHVDDRGREHAYAYDDVLRVMALSADCYQGLGILHLAKESIGLGLGRQKQSASFVGNGAKPSGILGIKSATRKEDRDEFQETWQKKYGGPENAGKIPVVWGDITYNQLGMTMVDAEWLAQQKFSVQEMARWFGVPPTLLFELDRATWSNMEPLLLEFLQFSLSPWLEAWTDALADALLTEDERDDGYYFEHETGAILKTTTKERYEAYAAARQASLLTSNELRSKENLDPVGPEGDVLVIQSNMVPLGDMALSYEERNPPTPEPAASPNNRRLEASVKQTYLRAVSAVLTKEALAAKAAAKKPATFLAWLEEFYGRHEGFVLDALKHPANAVYAAFGVDAEWDAELARRHCERSRADLLAAAECQPEQLAEAVDIVAARWETERLEKLAAELEVEHV